MSNKGSDNNVGSIEKISQTSDKNVANIEDDIKLVKRYLENSAYKETDSDFFKNGGWEIIDLEIPRAMENILAELEQKDKRIQELEEYITIAPDLDEMTAIKYVSIQQDAYIKGRADEQQKAEQIIQENYIPKQAAIDRIEELKKLKTALPVEHLKEAQIKVLQELLEGENRKK